MILGIDASTPGSGGAKRHLEELLKCFDPELHGFRLIKIWGVTGVLERLPDAPYIQKFTHPALNKGFLHRTFWQMFIRDKSFQNQFHILFSPFGTYTGNIKPYISMSRNMLIFDKKEQKRFGISWMRLKFILLNFKQKKSFKQSSGIIFLSKHAKLEIGKSVDLSNIKTQIIHHGVSDKFSALPKTQQPASTYNFQKPFKFLYVSTIWIYKHPWNLVEAVANLRKRNFPVVLDIVGNNEQKSAGEIFAESIKKFDPHSEFVTWHQHIGLNEVASQYKKADAFAFASSCENMPNILIEAMSSGLPVASSSYQPMPEFLQDGGLYFDPENAGDIEKTLERLFLDHELRQLLSSRSYDYSTNFTWSKCADQTFAFLHSIIQESTHK